MTDILIDDQATAVEIQALTANEFQSWAADGSEQLRRWLAASGVNGNPAQTALIADDAGRPDGVVHIVGDREPPIWQLAGLPKDAGRG